MVTADKHRTIETVFGNSDRFSISLVVVIETTVQSGYYGFGGFAFL